jgi:hypothetical protein
MLRLKRGNRYDSPVVRRHAASLGIQARLAFGTIAARSRSRLCGCRRCCVIPIKRRRQIVAGNWQDSGATIPVRNGSPARAGCVCTPFFSIRNNPERISIAISAAGAFRTDDGGKTGSQSIAGCTRSTFRTRTRRSVTACIGSRCIRRARNTLFMQKHWDVMRSDDAGGSWHEVSGNLPSDFGFPIDVHAHEPETIYVVPIKSDSSITPQRQIARVSQPDRWQRLGSPNERSAATELLRERVTRRDVGRFARSLRRLFRNDWRPGLRLGGCGDKWKPIVRDLPAVLSVEAQTLP